MFWMSWIFKSKEKRVSCVTDRWLNLTFEVRLMLRSITFDIKVHLSRKARSSGDDDMADVESGVRLLGVVDVDGEVGWGHGHAEAHSFGELVLAVPDLAWTEVYHLKRENTFMEILDLQRQFGVYEAVWGHIRYLSVVTVLLRLPYKDKSSNSMFSQKVVSKK